MKKFTIIVFLLCYIAATFGVATHKHYCGNKLTATYIFKAFTKVCGCASEKGMKGCCKEELTVKKIEDSQNYAHISLLKEKLLTSYVSAPFFLLECSSVFAPKQTSVYFTNAPPTEHSPPIYLLNRQILI